MSDDQISFAKIGSDLIAEKLRKTNIDEMNDTELRDFVRDLLRYL